MANSASDIEKALKSGTLPATDDTKKNTSGLVKVANRTDGKDVDFRPNISFSRNIPSTTFPSGISKRRTSKK